MYFLHLQRYTLATITYLKLTIETEQGVKYV